ncbi:unnamed protein product [Candidula unifasciata]|uniref:DUF4773 domain-containing protein n=1 Tax=Candidula unifasciata TaxID=100452 RepID=A0A8S3Z7Y6_9EUPU|nr:unnamed protein product [Candidula unifasciata]
MLLNVSLIFAAALSLVSCLSIGNMVQNARNEGIYAMEIAEEGAGDTVKTIDKEGKQTLRVIDKGAEQTVNVIDKGAKHTVNVIDKGAEQTLSVIDKGAKHTVNVINKGAEQTLRVIDKGAKHTLSVIDKGADQTLSIIDKGAKHTLSVIDKDAEDTLSVIDKDAEDTLSVIDKGATKSLKSAEDFFIMLKKEVNSNSTCACVNYTCGCCLQVVVEKISLNETGCLNISYLPDEYGFEFLFTLNGLAIIDEKISVKNPPPVCAAIPYIHQVASLCIRFYNLDYKAKQFSGCADVEIEVERVVLKKYDLGCIHIPPSREHKLIIQ